MIQFLRKVFTYDRGCKILVVSAIVFSFYDISRRFVTDLDNPHLLWKDLVGWLFIAYNWSLWLKPASPLRMAPLVLALSLPFHLIELKQMLDYHPTKEPFFYQLGMACKILEIFVYAYIIISVLVRLNVYSYRSGFQRIKLELSNFAVLPMRLYAFYSVAHLLNMAISIGLTLSTGSSQNGNSPTIPGSDLYLTICTEAMRKLDNFLPLIIANRESLKYLRWTLLVAIAEQYLNFPIDTTACPPGSFGCPVPTLFPDEDTIFYFLLVIGTVLLEKWRSRMIAKKNETAAQAPVVVVGGGN